MSPCNCGKNRDRAAQRRPFRPQGEQPSNGSAEASSTAQTVPATGAPAPQSGSTQSFALRLPDGSEKAYGSRLEADAARVRGGYRGQVVPR